MKKIILLLLFLLSVTLNFAQITLYSENFTAQNGKGAIGVDATNPPIIDLSGVTWNIDISSSSLIAVDDWFSVQNEIFEARDVDGESIWMSPNIPITGYTNIYLTLDASESGTAEIADYIHTQYRIDGGVWIDADINGYLSGEFTNASVSSNISIGTNLELRVLFNNTAGAEYHRIDNILVQGTFADTDSEVIAGTQPAGISSVSSLNDTPSAAISMFNMIIKDNGSGDGLPTKVSTVRITPFTTNTALWSNTIQGVILDDGLAYLDPLTYSTTITDAYIDITFNTGAFDVADGTTRDLNFSFYFNTSNIIENSTLSFMVDAANHGFIADTAGSLFTATFPSGNFNSNDFTISVDATKMQFLQQPTDVEINTIMTPAVLVAYTDKNGNVDVDMDGVGLTATLSVNGSALAASTTTAGTPILGIMTFNDIQLTVLDTNVTLTVTDSGWITNTVVTSTPFEVKTVKCNVITGVIIAQQDFEDVPATPTLTYIADANVVPSSGQGTNPVADLFVSGTKGVQVNNATGFIDFNSIDVSNYQNISFSIRLAAFTDSATNNGLDQGDYVLVRIFNGTYSKEIQVNGFSNSSWSFSGGTGIAQTSYDGDDSQLIFEPTAGGTQTTEGYSTINITNLPVTNDLRIQIEIVNDYTGEYWVLDDAVLLGDRKDFTVWDDTTKSWSNGAPTNTKKAFIDTPYNTNDAGNPGDFTACECETKAGITLTVGANKYIKIGNDLINNGKIYIQDDGSLIQENQNVTISGTNFKIEKTTTPYRMYDYTYWSSPIVSADLGTVFAANPQNRIYSFTTANFDDTDGDTYDDNGDDWTLASGTMTTGKGYIVMGEGAQFPVPNPIPTTTQQQTVQFIGKINNGDVWIPVTLDANPGDAFTNQNLIGNPYPSAISTPAFLAKNSSVIGGTLYFWTHNDQISTITGPDTYNFTNDSYVTYVSGTGGVLGNCSGCTIPTDYIASGQSFFVDASIAGNVLFNNAMRSPINNNFYRSSEEGKNRIWIDMNTNTNDFRQILIGFFNEATNGADRDYDGKRIENGDSFDFYSLIGTDKYAVQGVPSLIDEKIIPIGIEAPVTCNTTFSIRQFEGDLDQVNVYIKDNYLDILHNLKQENYTAAINQTGNINDRFEIVFSRNSLSTNSNTISNSNELLVANKDEQILVKSLTGKIIKNIKVFDVLGKLQYQNDFNTTEILLNTSFNHASVYFIQTTLDNGQVLTKKIIKF